MPKKPSLKLFQLIQSLSGTEKRYFKLFIGDDNSKYLQLFEAIDSQSIYDEDQLQKIIYPQETIQSRKFSELKSYLYELILKSLKSYDERSSVDFKLKGMIQSASILYKRSLFSSCKDILKKAFETANKFESFVSILEILKWEKKIAHAEKDINFLDKELERIQSIENKTTLQLKNQNSYRNLFFRLIAILKKDALVRNKEQENLIRQLMKSDLLVSEERAQSHMSKILFHRIHSVYFYAMFDFEQYYLSNKAVLKIMDESPIFLKEDISEYIATLNNLTMGCGLTYRYNEVEECLQRMKDIVPLTYDDSIKLHKHYYTHLFMLYIHRGQFKDGVLSLKEHYKSAKKFNPGTFKNNSFLFQQFYLYFGDGAYDEAIKILNKWIALKSKSNRKDLQSISWILNMITHYELGNKILLESLIRKTIRSHKKLDKIYLFEKKMIEFFRKIIKTNDGKTIKKIFIKLKEDLLLLSQKKEEQIMFRYFDFISWVDGKILNQPFAKVIMDKRNQQYV